MNVNGIPYKTVWMEGSSVFHIEQNKLPFEFAVYEAKTYQQSCFAISSMIVRGAGAIGASAGFAMAQAFLSAPTNARQEYLLNARKEIEATRPTARNLFFATEKVFEAGQISVENAVACAQKLAHENDADGEKIGILGNELIQDGFRIETHCNAGWLGFVDWGSALAPIYKAHQSGKKIFVYADETRPRSQGARLTAWEMVQAGIEHRIIPDNAGAYLMAQGKVDLMIVGADRIARNGDTANKIGTLEKAIAAQYYGVPFYVAAPFSTFDLGCPDGAHIPIEERSEEEVLTQTGPDADGKIRTIRVCAPESKAINPAFDVTPASLIKGIITERGIIKPNEKEILKIAQHDR